MECSRNPGPAFVALHSLDATTAFSSLVTTTAVLLGFFFRDRHELPLATTGADQFSDFSTVKHRVVLSSSPYYSAHPHRSQAGGREKVVEYTSKPKRGTLFMKIKTASQNKQILDITKKEWIAIGRSQGWITEAQAVTQKGEVSPEDALEVGKVMPKDPVKSPQFETPEMSIDNIIKDRGAYNAFIESYFGMHFGDPKESFFSKAMRALGINTKLPLTKDNQTARIFLKSLLGLDDANLDRIMADKNAMNSILKYYSATNFESLSLQERKKFVLAVISAKKQQAMGNTAPM